MRTFVKELTNPGVTLTAYLPAASDEMPNYKTRPAILVIPGGAYMMCSDREAEPIALSFLAKGYAPSCCVTRSVRAPQSSRGR